MRLGRARELLVRVPEDLVVARELDQHPRPSGSAAAVSAGHSAPCRRTGLRPVASSSSVAVRGTLYCSAWATAVMTMSVALLSVALEERLVGLELVPGIDRTAGGGDREQQEHARERRPEPVAPPPRPLGAADDVVGGNADQAGDHLGEAERLAVAASRRSGPRIVTGRVGDRAVGRKLVAQRRREVVRPRCPRR